MASKQGSAIPGFLITLAQQFARFMQRVFDRFDI
jgi:hypothetical protein